MNNNNQEPKSIKAPYSVRDAAWEIYAEASLGMGGHDEDFAAALQRDGEKLLALAAEEQGEKSRHEMLEAYAVMGKVVFSEICEAVAKRLVDIATEEESTLHDYLQAARAAVSHLVLIAITADTLVEEVKP
jgi:alkylation response protein AidB-like acyl-CoA dehydrogenase